MSGQDLYLVLRERLETVADTIHIDKDILDEAQSARGFSHERMARELYISEKTWRRWKAKGAISMDRVDDVATVLNLDIERPPARRVVLAEEVATGAGAEEVASQLEGLGRHQEELAATIRDIAAGQVEILAAIENARAQVLAVLEPPPARPKRTRT